jgi:pilin/secretion family protein with methylation motif
MSCAIRTSGRGRARGLTLVELVVAMGLFALLMIAVFDLLRSFLSLWDKNENRRALVEESSGVTELLASDLCALEPGPRGDLLAEWVFFDTDADGVSEALWPRLRFVRHATPAELARLQARVPPERRVEGEGLIEVCWCVVPAYRGKQEPDRRAEGLILRGERIVGSDERSFFEESFFGRSGDPTPGALGEVSGGLLWLGLQFATQTSDLRNGWRLGAELDHTGASWDGWNRKRPDATRHAFNEPGAGMPKARERVILPRRIRAEVEFERPVDVKRRTRLSRLVAPEDSALDVDDADRLPEREGAFLRVDSEWMQITSILGRSATVKRAQRGTQAVAHERGAMLHWGEIFVREIPIRVEQEDWNL